MGQMRESGVDAAYDRACSKRLSLKSWVTFRQALPSPAPTGAGEEGPEGAR
jgi:hypothetical protein